MIKRIFFIFLSAMMLFLAGCGKDNEKNKESFSIEGSWELTSMQTKSVTIGNQTVDVYLTFSSGNFIIYQRLGAGHFASYTGTYSFTGGILSGKYSDGRSLGSTYTVEGDGDRMILSTSGGAESDVYTRISSIPESVTSNILE